MLTSILFSQPVSRNERVDKFSESAQCIKTFLLTTWQPLGLNAYNDTRLPVAVAHKFFDMHFAAHDKETPAEPYWLSASERATLTGHHDRRLAQNWDPSNQRPVENDGEEAPFTGQEPSKEDQDRWMWWSKVSYNVRSGKNTHLVPAFTKFAFNSSLPEGKLREGHHDYPEATQAVRSRRATRARLIWL